MGGVTIRNMYNKICRQCGASFKGGPRAYYCPICRVERTRDSWRKFAQKGRKADRPIGSMDKCVACGCDYVVNSARQKYCPNCAPEQVKAVDRVQGLDYYANNQDSINLYRTMTRYQDRACAVCGKMFKTKTKQLTCSPECHKTYVNKKWVDNYNRRKSTL